MSWNFYQGKMSARREAELRRHLTKRRYNEKCIQNTINDMNRIRTGKVKIMDFLPGLEGIVKYYDIFESFKILDFLVDEFENN